MSTDFQEDASKLGYFLYQLDEELDWIIEHRSYLLSRPLQESANLAWEEQRPRIKYSIKYLKDIRGQPTFIQEALSVALSNVGLRADSLQLKLEGVQHARNELETEKPQGDFSQGKWNRVKRRVGKYFRWSDIILGSLSGILPLDPIRELKEGFEEDMKQDVQQ